MRTDYLLPQHNNGSKNVNTINWSYFYQTEFVFKYCIASIFYSIDEEISTISRLVSCYLKKLIIWKRRFHPKICIKCQFIFTHETFIGQKKTCHINTYVVIYNMVTILVMFSNSFIHICRCSVVVHNIHIIKLTYFMI